MTAAHTLDQNGKATATHLDRRRTGELLWTPTWQLMSPALIEVYAGSELHVILCENGTLISSGDSNHRADQKVPAGLCRVDEF